MNLPFSNKPNHPYRVLKSNSVPPTKYDIISILNDTNILTIKLLR